MALAEASGEAPETADEPAEGGALFTAGTYEETVSGRNGKMTVEVVLGEDKIEAVNVKDHQETATVASVALERVPSKIVELQTTNVDAVTGATVTSNAIIYAVKEAVKEAGGDQAALDAIDGKAKPQDTIEKTADVIVVGGGGAGIGGGQNGGGGNGAAGDGVHFNRVGLEHHAGHHVHGIGAHALGLVGAFDDDVGQFAVLDGQRHGDFTAETLGAGSEDVARLRHGGEAGQYQAQNQHDRQ